MEKLQFHKKMSRMSFLLLILFAPFHFLFIIFPFEFAKDVLIRTHRPLKRIKMRKRFFFSNSEECNEASKEQQKKAKRKGHSQFYRLIHSTNMLEWQERIPCFFLLTSFAHSTFFKLILSCIYRTSRAKKQTRTKKKTELHMYGTFFHTFHLHKKKWWLWRDRKRKTILFSFPIMSSRKVCIYAWRIHN